MAFLGKKQKSLCVVISMNADVCLLNLWMEFAAAGNQKSMETHVFYVFSTLFITRGYIYALIYFKQIYWQTAIGWCNLFSIFFEFM